MEHPPLAIFVNGVSAAMNELRPCAPVSLKLVLAQEVIKGLRAVSDSLMLYNATRMLRQNESQLFLSLCRAFLEVAYPHCATCFGRCYPGGAALITESKSLFDGVSQLLAVAAPPPRAPTRELPRVVNESEEKHVSQNNSDPVAVDNGVLPDAQAELSEQSETPEVDGSEQTSTPAEKQGEEEA
ncbi:hypothetical protein C5167_021278 [Papaver somniferum]|uniref:Conserved oligomeric Golgi complex subunit 8 n=2 Tax=Papaver somniferum TaxID=3469 RepID=A0A4Y7IZM2_PAPSO|nr:hypothetical protein C5167_021278 [Papaver somniferum]